MSDLPAKRKLIRKHLFPLPDERVYEIPTGASHYCMARGADGVAVYFWGPWDLSVAERVAALGGVGESELVDQAAAALNVLSTRLSHGQGGDAFYAVNRALREVDQVREMRSPDEESPLRNTL